VNDDYIRGQLRKSSMTDQEIEEGIKAKGLTAPRITPADIENTIIAECYTTGDHIPIWMYPQPSGATDDPRKRIIESLSCLTVCVLVLRNGFTVTGESACASPENFNEVLGRKIAYQKAIEKIWSLEGYVLKSRLSSV